VHLWRRNSSAGNSEASLTGFSFSMLIFPFHRVQKNYDEAHHVAKRSAA
jgi:hypothetical protein